MADVQLHQVLRAIRGTMGDVVFKKRGNTLYISRRPDFSKRKLSAAQKKSVARFRSAVRYAQGVLADLKRAGPLNERCKRQGRPSTI